MNKQQKLLPDEMNFAKEIVGVPVEEEMQESFLAYSLSVITSRAIPDVKDGLKPVQRRILYTMLRMGLRPENPHRKSARVVGDTMGRYHPHGDAAIYDALVRMGQDFSRGMTLVDNKAILDLLMTHLLHLATQNAGLRKLQWKCSERLMKTQSIFDPLMMEKVKNPLACLPSYQTF